LHLGAIDRWLPFGYAVLVAAGGFWTAYRRAGRTPDLVPLLAVTAAEIAGLVALVALYYAQIVPPSVTLYSSAASRETLAFLVIAICVFIPGTIAYHAYANWVFRGRQPLDEGGN
jgi:cytochrome bd-type quinol oxidase subunit 2